MTAERHLVCPSCGVNAIHNNKCTACGWAMCEDGCTFKRVVDEAVGIERHLECVHCGVAVTDEGQCDEEPEREN